MADVPCSGFPCLDVYHWVKVRIIFVGKSPECPWPDSKDLDKVKDELRKKVEETYPPIVRVRCPNHCHCEFIGKPISDKPVKGEQHIREPVANECEYYLILEVDVERTVQVGMCHEGGEVLVKGGS